MVSALLNHIKISSNLVVKTNIVHVASSLSHLSSEMLSENMSLLVNNLKNTLDFQERQEDKVLFLFFFFVWTHLKWFSIKRRGKRDKNNGVDMCRCFFAVLGVELLLFLCEDMWMFANRGE